VITIQEETYKNLVEHSPDAVIITSCGIILYINDTGVNLLGAERKEDIVGRGLFDFLSADYFEAYHKYISDVQKGKVRGFTNHKFYRKDGSLFEAEIKGIQTTFENNPAIHLIVRDIEQRKKTESFLLQSEKLLIAGQLAAGIAHEVRNPLTAIKGFLQLVEDNFSENKTYFDIICSEINRIETILSELLTLAKPKEMEYRKYSLYRLIDEVITLLDTEALMNNVEIKSLTTSELPTILCDESQLKQVFINFIKNSIEAMPNGGKVTIEVANQTENEIKLLFRDTGCGIPEQLLKRIEEPFFTTKEKGTGLGLMISKQIIENHHGRIQYHSNGHGTTVELTLPKNGKDIKDVRTLYPNQLTQYKFALH
jgi:two-component system, sporulation sensor kinase A